jgi:CubicO group peptidase (beta-lactamase class C family)
MKRTVRTAAVLLLAFLAGLRPGYGQADDAQKIEALIRPFAEAGQFSGVVLAAERGRIIYEKAFGLADAEFSVPNRTDTRFGIASITKLMTVVVLTRLAEAGRIALSDPLAKFIPDFPRGDKITVDMLMRHRSGIPHRVMPPEAESLPYTTAEFADKVKAAKLEFEPGTKRLYSSAGYAVLARVLEIASGRPYAGLLQDYVFGPAGMTDSLDFQSEAIMARRAEDYLLSPQGPVNAALKDYSFLVGAGSVFSTAADLDRFGRALQDGTLGRQALALIAGPQGISGSGSTNGHRAYLEIEKEGNYGYALVSNLNCGSIDLILRGLAAILKGQEPPAASVPRPRVLPDPDPSPYLGSYRREDGTRVDLRARDGGLWAGDDRLYAVGPDRFFEYKYYGDVLFQRDASGAVTGMRWNWPGSGSDWAKQR